MPIYRVRLYNGPMRDGGRDVDLEADDPQSAAESVCGEKLATEGPIAKYRAEAWLLRKRPQVRTSFYLM